MKKKKKKKKFFLSVCGKIVRRFPLPVHTGTRHAARCSVARCPAPAQQTA
jgi:hypothetical protein